MLKSQLDQRICDCEDGVENTQTYREFFRETEDEFKLPHADLDDMAQDELDGFLEFADYLWEK